MVKKVLFINSQSTLPHGFCCSTTWTVM